MGLFTTGEQGDEFAVESFVNDKLGGNFSDRVLVPADISPDFVEDIEEVTNGVDLFIFDDGKLGGKGLYLSPLQMKNLKTITAITEKYEKQIAVTTNPYLLDESEIYPLSRAVSKSKAVSQIENEIKSKNLSPLEAYLYAYTSVLDNFKYSAKTQEIPPLSTNRNLANDPTEMIAEVLSRIGIPCSFKHARTDVDNFGFKSKKYIPGHKALYVVLIDGKYGISNLFYADPYQDCQGTKNPFVCHSLLTLGSAEDILSKKGQYKLCLSEASELGGQRQMLANAGVSNYANDFQTRKSFLENDSVFEQYLEDEVEKLIFAVYKEKELGDDTYRRLFRKFGEGKKNFDSSMNDDFLRTFLAVFKNACKKRVSDFTSELGNNARYAFLSKYDGADKEFESAKKVVTDISENVGGITPTIFKDLMLDAIQTKDYFGEGSAFDDEFAFVVDMYGLKIDVEKIQGTAESHQAKAPNFEGFEEALFEALLAKTNDEKKAKEQTQKIIFSSTVLASEKWNLKKLGLSKNQNASPFAETVLNSQKTKQ